MDRQKAKILFDLLRSSTEKIIKGLREIKKRLQTNTENIGVFSKLGIAKQCLKLIQRPNEEILNGTLSVLSIVCTDPSLRVEIYDSGGTLHLYNVLKGTKSEPLQLRVVRTIANQSQHKPSCDAFFRYGCPNLIITLLQESKEDETKCAAIRALRLLANNGEHCQKIVVQRGIFHIGVAGRSSSSGLLNLDVYKALAHFSRVSHPSCLKQIMEATENLSGVAKVFESGDLSLQEQILRMMITMVYGCSELKKHSHYKLTTQIMDNLAMAHAPSIIVCELMNRRIPDISEDKLITALCDFCEGFGLPSKCNYPPLFSERAWAQVLESGGITYMVTVLSKQDGNTSMKTSMLRAFTGIEFLFSLKDKILKHLLAANVMPILAKQFDEVMREYRSVRRESQEGYCSHTAPTDLAAPGNAADSSKDGADKVRDDDKAPEISEDKIADGIVEDDVSMEKYNIIVSEDSLDEFPAKDGLCSKSKAVASGATEDVFYGGGGQGTKLFVNTEVGIYGKPTSPGAGVSFPSSSGSVSCSPTSYQSSTGSGQNSPTWSPAFNSCESPVSSPASSFVSGGGHCPWESPTSSHPSSPSSPSYFPPWLSPPRSTSPIKSPSDWEYEDEDDESYENGRFSPVITKAKDSEETEDDMDDLDESEVTNTEEANTEDDSTSADEGIAMKEESIELNTKKMLVMSLSTSQKRPRGSSPSFSSNEDPDPVEKKVKMAIEVSVGDTSEREPHDVPLPSSEHSSSESTSCSKCEAKEACETSSSSEQIKSPHAGDSKGSPCKTTFIKMNEIKFRVPKRPRRLLSTDPEDTSHSAATTTQNIKDPPPRTRSCSISSESAYSDLTTDEYKWLHLLELLVRVIGQIAFVKEAINSVCREFVPRITVYLSTAQIIHKASTLMLKTIAKNSLSIPTLLDSLFIPYVAVELGEAGNPENPSGCSQCRVLHDGSAGFLSEMENFFNHIHVFGRTEVSSRLNPSKDPGIRERCVMALPHVMRCPKLLYDFMILYPAMDLLMDVLHSERLPSEASYMYATAALSRLAMTLQLDKQLQPVKCPVCSERRTHSPEEVTKHLRMQQELMKSQEAAAIKAAENLSGLEQSRQCKFALDEVKDVTFKLEGGETLSANREFLSEKNEIMNSMLMGSFLESSSQCVELPETRKDTLEMLIHFLYGCQCDFMENSDFHSYLQLVMLSQMYLVENLDAFAVMKMISSISEGKDIVALYESGLGRIDEKIVLQAICTTLVRPMKTWKRAQWFKELFQSKHSADIDHNIRVILHHPLDINRLVCNCDQSRSRYAANNSVYSKYT